VPTHVDGLRAVGRVSQTDLGAALNLNDLLVAGESPTGSGVRPVNAYGQAVAAMTDTQTDEEEQAVARRMERLARAAAKAREAKGTSLPALYDVHAGLQTFCRGAGIDTQTLPAEAQTRLLHLAGQLVREALVGLKDLERARREIHNRFRIELPEAEDDPRPSLARSTIEELLVELFGQHESRRLDAVQWLRDTVEGSKAHERATMEAMREAFVEFIERFNPAELEARFQRSSRRGKKSAGGEAHWEMFAEFYRNLTEMPPDHLPHTFVEAFALAYKKNLTG
jgi:type VI secretion system FHA domain protein